MKTLYLPQKNSNTLYRLIDNFNNIFNKKHTFWLISNLPSSKRIFNCFGESWSTAQWNGSFFNGYI